MYVQLRKKVPYFAASTDAGTQGTPIVPSIAQCAPEQLNNYLR